MVKMTFGEHVWLPCVVDDCDFLVLQRKGPGVCNVCLARARHYGETGKPADQKPR